MNLTFSKLKKEFLALNEIVLNAITLSQLPFFEKRGIYFLIKDERIVYVGQSENLFTRIHSHKSDKDFDRVYCIICEGEHLNEIEAEYIVRSHPFYNKTLPVNTRYLPITALINRIRVLTNKGLSPEQIKSLGVEPIITLSAPTPALPNGVKMSYYDIEEVLPLVGIHDVAPNILINTSSIKWMPIESAPKDRRVLLYFPSLFDGGYVSMGYWNNDEHSKKKSPFWTTDGEHWIGKYNLRVHEPTHYAYIPHPEGNTNE